MSDNAIPFNRNPDTTNAANLPFDPATLAHWASSADPGSAKAALDQLASRLTTIGASRRVPTLTVGAEASQAISINLTALNGIGAAVAVADKIQVQVFTDAAYSVQAIPADFTLLIGAIAVGSLTSNSTAVTQAIYTTSAAGAVNIKVTDVSGVFAGSVYVRYTYLSVSGGLLAAAPFDVAITFA